MTKQDQAAESGSVAVQSGRDTVINQGLSPEQMKQIMEGMAAQLPAFATIAREVVNERLNDFENCVLSRFSESNSAKSEAFKDPDFQYLLAKAEHAYARSGDEGIRDILVDLIAERSKQTERNRLTLSLNQAVEIAPYLTINEFSELSLSFIFVHTVNQLVNSIDTFVDYLKDSASPLLPHISKERASYMYLEAQSCAKISIGSHYLHDIILRNYGGLLSSGFDEDELESRFSKDVLDLLNNAQLIIPCVNDRKKLQISSTSKRVFSPMASQAGLKQDSIEEVWTLFEQKMWNRDEMIRILTPKWAGIRELFDVWENTLLVHLELTSVGIAIAHANLVRLMDFDASLATWIR